MSPILTSTLILTLLLAIGLLFFIKASVKDRIESLELDVKQTEADLLPQVEGYFRDRSYRVIGVDAATNVVTFEGLVRPSGFLASFLALLAACGAGCLALVLAMVLPQIGYWFLLLLFLAPVAGWFYWQRSARLERVLLKLEPQTDAAVTKVAVTGHRDELAIFESMLKRSTPNGIK
jgi:Flp pilus assembly protein TadB